MIFYLCCLGVVLALVGFFMQSVRRNGHGMVYSAVIGLMWAGLAAWTGGYLNG